MYFHSLLLTCWYVTPHISTPSQHNQCMDLTLQVPPHSTCPATPWYWSHQTHTSYSLESNQCLLERNINTTEQRCFWIYIAGNLFLISCFLFSCPLAMWFLYNKDICHRMQCFLDASASLVLIVSITHSLTLSLSHSVPQVYLAPIRRTPNKWRLNKWKTKFGEN